MDDDDETVWIVCVRMADGPAGPVGYVGSCALCQSAVAISPESYKQWSGTDGPRKTVCVPCFRGVRHGKFDLADLQAPSPGVIEELRTYFKENPWKTR